MATYAEISAWIRRNHGFVPQPCWIANVKSKHGLTRGDAHNRLSPLERIKPCPPDRRDAIEGAVVHFCMI